MESVRHERPIKSPAKAQLSGRSALPRLLLHRESSGCRPPPDRHRAPGRAALQIRGWGRGPRFSLPLPPLLSPVLSHMGAGGHPRGAPGSLRFSLMWLVLGLEEGRANPICSLALSTRGRPAASALTRRRVRCRARGCPLEATAPLWSRSG